MSLHDPAQVKLLIKQRVKNGLMPHLAPAGTTPTAADLTTYYKQELEAFFTDFENDTDFQKVASSITGGKNVLTEIGSVGP